MAIGFTPDACEFRLIGAEVGNPDPVTTGFGLKLTSPAVPELAGPFLVDVWNEHLDDLVQDCHAAISWDGWSFSWSPDPGLVISIDGLFADPHPGGGAEDPFAPQASYVIRKRSLATGRHGRGRSFLAGVRESVVIGGRITPTALIDMNNHLNTWVGEMQTDMSTAAGGDVEFCINGAVGGVASSSPLVQMQYSREIGWLRRRGPTT